MYLTSTPKHSIPPLQRRFNTIIIIIDGFLSHALFKSRNTAIIIMPDKIHTCSMDLWISFAGM